MVTLSLSLITLALFSIVSCKTFDEVPQHRVFEVAPAVPRAGVAKLGRAQADERLELTLALHQPRFYEIEAYLARSSDPSHHLCWFLACSTLTFSN